jgi:HK97 gp10 family phage protein
MADDVKCEIEGLAELEKLLTQLAPKEAKTAMRRSERKAAALWQSEIERLAPKDSDFLEEHIAIRSSAGSGDDNSTGSISVIVGPTDDVYPLEGGRKKNRNAAQAARYAEFGTIHEAARPFISVAYENKRDEVVSTFQSELGTAINKLTPQ